MPLDNETIKMMLEIIMNEQLNKNQIEPKFISDTPSKLIFNEPPKIKRSNKKEVEEIPKLVLTEPPKIKRSNKKEIEEIPKLLFTEPPKKNNKKEVEEIPKLLFTEPPKKNNKKEVEEIPKLLFTEPPKNKRSNKKEIKNEIEPKIIIKNEIEPKEVEKYKKKSIPSALKRLVWNKWIGEEIGKFKCLCCNVTDINQMSFNCGHIIAESKGGETILSNLKPICQNCNSSMGSQNMDDFMKTFE